MEFGDFQTPRPLADRLCSYLAREGCRPASIVEPTCGTGTFVLAALQAFPDASYLIGVERNASYLEVTRSALAKEVSKNKAGFRLQDFFDVDWPSVFVNLPEPILLIGNPPWVTSDRVGALSGSNVPKKSNFLKLSGLDAKTGSSNFDIAEWMLINLWECLKHRRAWIAVLVKTSVARRILQYTWSDPKSVCNARLLPFDAMKSFEVSADAGILVLQTEARQSERKCEVSDMTDWSTVVKSFGMLHDTLIGDLDAYARTDTLRALHPRKQPLRWRSGIKHDCAPVLELRQVGAKYFNQLGESVGVEPEWLFPLMKGSEVANEDNGPIKSSGRFAIVPQRSTGDDTRRLEVCAPHLWQYLSAHREFFAKRRSSVYKGRTEFAVFGIGPYTFRPWKIAICGLYKRFSFALIGPRAGRPVVFDDTSYHLSFESEEEARFILELLRSAQAEDFFSARVFWDSKRPITARLLQQLDLLRLARMLGRLDKWNHHFERDTLLGALAG